MTDLKTAAATGATIVTPRRDLSCSDLCMILNEFQDQGATISDDLMELVRELYYAGYSRGFNHGKSVTRKT